tara:strand:+ start:200 stop:439 length:240 start_codon:yes stop_codon:yes gene_type:complete
MNDNVIKFPYKVKKTEQPVKVVCELAADSFVELVLIGTTKDGQIQMITTLKDSAVVLWGLENAKLALMQGLEEEDEHYE